MQDIALYTIGPVFIAGINATTNEVIGNMHGSILMELTLLNSFILLCSCMLWKLERKL